MINGNTFGYPSPYSSVYSADTTPTPPLISSTNDTNAFTMPQTQTGFSYQSPQFDATGSTTPDLNTVLQSIIGIVAQVVQTMGAGGSENSQAAAAATAENNSGSAAKAKQTPTPAPKSTEKASEPAPAMASNDGGLSNEQQEFLNLVNKARKDAGLNPVTANAGIMKEATEYSQDIENSGGGLTHTLNGSQFGDRIKKGYDWHSSANENLAQGKSAQEAFDALMNDPPHKSNILDPNVSQIGIGHMGNTWTQDMAT